MTTAWHWKAWRPPLHRELRGHSPPGGEGAPILRINVCKCLRPTPVRSSPGDLLGYVGPESRGQEGVGEGGEAKGTPSAPLSLQPEDSHVLDPSEYFSI